jgi:hypothetical protein
MMISGVEKMTCSYASLYYTWYLKDCLPALAPWHNLPRLHVYLHVYISSHQAYMGKCEIGNLASRLRLWVSMMAGLSCMRRNAALGITVLDLL